MVRQIVPPSRTAKPKKASYRKNNYHSSYNNNNNNDTPGTTTTTTTTFLKLYPWRDGIFQTLQQLQGQNASRNKTIKTIHIVFDQDENFQQELTYDDVMLLFQTIGSAGRNGTHNSNNNGRYSSRRGMSLSPRRGRSSKNGIGGVVCLPNLETVRIQMNASPQFALNSVALPPLAALTSLLLGSSGGGTAGPADDDDDYDDYDDHDDDGDCNRIKAISLVGLRLFGDDYDMNGFLEALRIHPTLSNVTIQNCWFIRENHVQQIKHVLRVERKLLKVSIIDNQIVDENDEAVAQFLTMKKKNQQRSGANINRDNNNDQYYYEQDTTSGTTKNKSFFSSFFGFVAYPLTCCL